MKPISPYAARVATMRAPSASVALALLALAVIAVRPSWSGAPSSANAVPAIASGDTLRLALEDAIQIALRNGVEMKLANAEVKIASGQIREAVADALPRVNASMGYTHRFDSVYRGVSASGADSLLGPILSNSPFAAVNDFSVDLDASQILFSRRVGAGLAAAHDYRRGTEALRDESAADVALAVKRAYYDAAAAGQFIQIAATGREQAESHRDQVALFHKQGTRAEYDLVQAQVDAMNAEPPVVAAHNEYETALLDLKRVLGLPLQTPVELTTPVTLDPDAVPVVADLAALAPANRAAVVAADAEVQGRKHLLDVERAARWPELKLTGSISHQAFPSQLGIPDRNEFHRNIEGGARLDFPLFRFQSAGAIQRAEAEMHQAEARREQVHQRLDLELERSRQEVHRTLAVVLARRGTASLAARAQHLATVRYGNGLSTQLEVADARLQLMTAEGNEVRAARDYRAALAGLEHALGRPLSLTNRPLDQLSLSMSSDAAPDAAVLTGKP